MPASYAQVYIESPDAEREMGRLLYLLQFGSGKKSAFAPDFGRLGENIVKMARYFIDVNKTERSGKMRRSITYDVKEDGVQIEVPVHYAPYIEYGFTHNHSREFIGPFPFIRPAIAWAADATYKDITTRVNNFFLEGEGNRVTFGQQRNWNPTQSAARNIADGYRSAYTGGAWWGLHGPAAAKGIYDSYLDAGNGFYEVRL